MSDATMKIIKESPVVIVDVWAPWCGPCKVLRPMIEKIAAEEGIPIVFVNAADETDFAIHFLNAQSLPTVIVFKDGKESGRIIGSFNEAVYRNKIKELL